MTSYSLSKTYGLFAVPEIEALKKVVRGLPKDSTAVVLGAGAGTTTLAILEARKDIVVYSVDIVVSKSERLHAKAGGQLGRLHQIKGRSETIGLTWDKPVNLLLVDAWHTYDAVKADNATWLPHLRDRGIAWYHDYGTSNEMYAEVKRAVDEDMEGQEEIVQVCSSIAFRRMI